MRVILSEKLLRTMGLLRVLPFRDGLTFARKSLDKNASNKITLIENRIIQGVSTAERQLCSHLPALRVLDVVVANIAVEQRPAGGNCANDGERRRHLTSPRRRFQPHNTFARAVEQSRRRPSVTHTPNHFLAAKVQIVKAQRR
jgi:hypothetical protein